MTLANLNYLFQSNCHVKCFTQQKFCDLYSGQISQALDEGKATDEIEISLKQLVINPLYAKWFVKLYNEMKDECERKVNLKGYQVAGQGAVQERLTVLSNIDSFIEIQSHQVGLTFNLELYQLP